MMALDSFNALRALDQNSPSFWSASRGVRGGELPGERADIQAE